MGLFSGDGAGVLGRLLKKYGAKIIGGLHIKMPDSIAGSTGHSTGYGGDEAYLPIGDIDKNGIRPTIDRLFPECLVNS